MERSIGDLRPSSPGAILVLILHELMTMKSCGAMYAILRLLPSLALPRDTDRFTLDAPAWKIRNLRNARLNNGFTHMNVSMLD